MNVPILQVTGLAYRDSVRAPCAVPMLSGIALVACLAQAFLAEGIQNVSPSAGMVFGLLLASATSFLVTPFLIAVHRYILLRETTTTIDVRSHRFQQFFIFSVLLILMMECMSVGYVVFGERTAAGMIVAVLVAIGFMFVSVRLVLLFPAIAIDSPDAEWPRSMDASRGNFWRIVLVCLLVLAPAILLLDVVVLGEAANKGAEKPLRLSTGVVLLMGLVHFYSQALLVAAASHLFLILGDKMSQRSGATA